MDAHTARLMIIGGGLVAVGGCVILKQLTRPKPATPPNDDEVRFQGINADGTARLYMTGVKGSFDIVVGDGPPLPGRRFNAFGEFVLSDAEKAGIAEADRIRAQLTDPKPAANPVAAGLFVSCVHPECGCEVEALCPEASTRHGDPADDDRCDWPGCGCEFDALCDAVLALPEAELHAEYAGDVPANYAPMEGRRHHARQARVVGNQIEAGLYDGERFVRLYTRRYNAIAAAYRLNAAIGSD